MSCRVQPRGAPTIDMVEITNYGIDRWTEGDFANTTFEDVARIRGFRVVKVLMLSDKVGDPDSGCRLYVDVADEQSLKVRLTEPDRTESDPPLCDVAYQYLEAAMRTLTSR